MNRKKKKISYSVFIFLIVILYSLISSSLESSYSKEIDLNDTGVFGKLKVYFLDVGQADCILIQNDEKNMLIDAGNNNDGELLVDYFKELNIDKFDYVVGTHPHEDHIGGLDDVINNFEIGTVYLPDVFTTTKTFEDVLDAIDSKNLSFKVPVIDDTFYLGDAKFSVIYTGDDMDDLNNSSIVLKMIFGDVSFLFTGDATDKVEDKILNKNIKADVLKVGHHGSKYSSTKNFLEKVSPKYAVISVGEDNIYNHPEDVILNRLDKLNIKVYRTDLMGSILVISDGINLEIDSFYTETNGGK